MILSRLAEAIRSQNWFTVLLEIAIVVVGILIGLQVDDWNQRRLDRENDRRVLALFGNELDYMLNQAADDLELTEMRMQNVARATRIALDCEASDEDRARLVKTIADAFDFRVPNIKPSGLAEVSNSGILARIGNPELTEVVGEVNERVKFTSDSMAVITPKFHRSVEMVLPYLVLAAPLELNEVSDEPTLPALSESMSLAPQQTICASQEFLLGMMEMATYYGSMTYTFRSWYKSLERARELAGRVTL